MTPIFSKNYVKRYVKYFSRILSHYGKGEKDIFTFLIDSIKAGFEPTIDRIKSSIEFITFYFALRDLETKKGLVKKEDILDELDKYSEKLKYYVESFNFPNTIAFSCIFDVNDFKQNEFLKEMAPNVLENPKNFRRFFGSETRSYLVGTIRKIAYTIQDVGMFSEYVNSNNKSARINNMSVLMINEGEDEKEDILSAIIKNLENKENDFFPTTAKEVFYEEWLEKQSLEQLIYMNLFWSNKFAKLIEDMYLLLLLLSKRKNLLEGIRRDDLDFNTLMYWIEEENLEQRTINKLLFEVKEIYNLGNNEIEKNSYKFINDFYFEDIYQLIPMYRFVGICYTLKKMSIFYALQVLENDKEVKNFGVTSFNEKVSPMAAFMIDVPRYNLPISFHIEKKSLYIFYTEFCKKDKIRKYIGHEDFYNENRKWGNSFLYPLTKSQREYIHKVKDLNKTFSHLDFLQRRIWPEHMKDAKGKAIKEFIDVKNLI